MFRAGLLLVIRSINSVQKAVGIAMRYVEWLLAVETYYRTKLIKNSAPRWFILYRFH